VYFDKDAKLNVIATLKPSLSQKTLDQNFRGAGAFWALGTALGSLYPSAAPQENAGGKITLVRHEKPIAPAKPASDATHLFSLASV
jgi:hypothetical protein